MNLKLARLETFGKEFIPESVYDWNTRGGNNDINLDDYYTKEECDDKFINKTSLDDYYTKEECDTNYLQKTGGTMTGILNMEMAQGSYMCFYDNNDSTIGSIGNDNGNLRMYGENGDLVLQSDHDVVLTASGDIRLEDANVSIGSPQYNRELTVNGSATIESDLTVNGDINTSASMTVNGETTINSKLTVNNWVEINYELVVNGGRSSFGDEVEFYGQVYLRDDIIVGTSGDTITLNKAFFQSILDRLTALENKN